LPLGFTDITSWGLTDARGPRGEKRSADVIGAAIMVARIATGEVTEKVDDKGESVVSQFEF
jgi:hypothetical protein